MFSYCWNNHWAYCFQTYIVNTDISLEVCNLVPATNYMVDIKIKPLGGTYYSNTADTDFETCHTGGVFSEMLLVYWDCDILKPWYTMYITVNNDYRIRNNQTSLRKALKFGLIWESSFLIMHAHVFFKITCIMMIAIYLLYHL